jgi:hypothetical protein
VRVSIIVCDRCGSRESEEDWGGRLLDAGKSKHGLAMKYDLCYDCWQNFDSFWMRHRTPLAEQQPKSVLEDRRKIRFLESTLEDVREAANNAIVKYQEGASPNVLIGALTDVASGANRRR